MTFSLRDTLALMTFVSLSSKQNDESRKGRFSKGSPLTSKTNYPDLPIFSSKSTVALMPLISSEKLIGKADATALKGMPVLFSLALFRVTSTV